jgi:hypothetical protein
VPAVPRKHYKCVSEAMWKPHTAIHMLTAGLTTGQIRRPALITSNKTLLCMSSRSLCTTFAGGKKQPYFISLGEGAVLFMAGLFDVYAGGCAVYTLQRHTRVLARERGDAEGSAASSGGMIVLMLHLGICLPLHNGPCPPSGLFTRACVDTIHKLTLGKAMHQPQSSL